VDWGAHITLGLGDPLALQHPVTDPNQGPGGGTDVLSQGYRQARRQRCCGYRSAGRQRFFIGQVNAAMELP